MTLGNALAATHVVRMKEIVTMMISVKKITNVGRTIVEVHLVIILNLTVATMKWKISAQLTTYVDY